MRWIFGRIVFFKLTAISLFVVTCRDVADTLFNFVLWFDESQIMLSFLLHPLLRHRVNNKIIPEYHFLFEDVAADEPESFALKKRNSFNIEDVPEKYDVPWWTGNYKSVWDKPYDSNEHRDMPQYIVAQAKMVDLYHKLIGRTANMVASTYLYVNAAKCEAYYMDLVPACFPGDYMQKTKKAVCVKFANIVINIEDIDFHGLLENQEKEEFVSKDDPKGKKIDWEMFKEREIAARRENMLSATAIIQGAAAQRYYFRFFTKITSSLTYLVGNFVISSTRMHKVLDGAHSKHSLDEILNNNNLLLQMLIFPSIILVVDILESLYVLKKQHKYSLESGTWDFICRFIDFNFLDKNFCMALSLIYAHDNNIPWVFQHSQVMCGKL